MDSTNTGQWRNEVCEPISMEQVQAMSTAMDETCVRLGLKGIRAVMAVSIFLRSVSRHVGLSVDQTLQILTQVPALDIEFRDSAVAEPIRKDVN